MLGEQVADLVGVSRYAFMSYEADETEPRLEDLQKIAAILEIEEDKLYDDYYSFLAYPYSTLIKNIRKQKSLRQHELGGLLNVHQGTVKRWESGEHTVTREVWQQMYNINFLTDTTQ